MRISAAVVEALLPILNDMKTDLNNNLNDLTATVANLEETVSDLNETVEDHKRQTTSEHTELHNSLETSINNPPTNVIAIAVLVKLLPYLNDIEENLCEKIDKSTNSLTEDLSSLNGSVTDLTEKVCNVSDSQRAQDMNETISSHMEHLNMKLMSVEASMRKEHRNIRDELEEHKNHVNFELIELENSHDDIDVKLDSLDTKQDELSMNILSNVTEKLKKTYDLLDEHLCGYTCGGEGGWRRVVYLNMTDPNTNCPTGWRLTDHSKRTCGRVDTSLLSCDSVFFPVPGGDYNRVCGTIRGYQVGYTDAFEAYHLGRLTTIDGAYVSGVSLTHGSPRQHIWTFAAGSTEEERQTWNDACPCDATIDIAIPPFVGEDYFCESGVNFGPNFGFRQYDPLWDGQNCTSTSTCCEMNNPPYFTKQLTSPTTDDIEARLCRLDIKDDSPVEFIELYVKGPADGECDSKLNSINSKIDEVTAILSNEHKDIRDDINEHKDHVNSELIELETNQDDIDVKLDSLDTKQDELSMKVMSVSSELEQNVHKEVKKTYDLLEEHVGYTCDGERGWRRVVYLNMTDSDTNCPSGWQLSRYFKRACGQVSTSELSCDSVFFPVTGGDYNKVCGTIRAYQVGQTDAFEAYHNGRVTTIDDAYVSLTHGSPRQHIWTFAAGATEDEPTRDDACPCDATIDIAIPPFVGGDYFCESGVNFGPTSGFHQYDPLWDGENCTSTSTCCEMNNPPYFTKQLSNPTTDDIEVRICQLSSWDDSPNRIHRSICQVRTAGHE